MAIKWILFICYTIGAVFFWAPKANAGYDFGKDLASPITTPARTPLIVGASLTIALTLLRHEIDYPLQNSINRDKPLGGFSKYGDYAGQVIPNGAYAAGMLIAGLTGNPEGYKRAEIMFFGTGYAALWSSLFKLTVRERRPGDSDSFNSFPSGHATTAFAFASVVAAEHEWYFAVPAYGLAALTGFSRMNDNRHFLHDVVAGATLGTAYGWGIHYIRRSTDKFLLTKEPSIQVMVLPLDNFEGGVLAAAGRF